MPRKAPKLGIASGKINEVFSACKIVDVDESHPDYLSTHALVYGTVLRKVSIIFIRMDRGHGLELHHSCKSRRQKRHQRVKEWVKRANRT